MDGKAIGPSICVNSLFVFVYFQILTNFESNGRLMVD